MKPRYAKGAAEERQAEEEGLRCANAFATHIRFILP